MFRIEDAEGNFYILEVKVVQKLPGYGDWPRAWQSEVENSHFELFGEMAP
jgi:hypothetical protein